MSTETTTSEIEYEDGSKIVETTTVESEYIPSDDAPELVAEVVEEVVEPTVDAAVQIAEIEAERDITIAAIHADVQQSAIEAEAENEDESEWRRNIETQLEATNNRLSELTALLTPPQSQQSEVSQAEPPAPASVDPTPVNPEAQESAPEQPKPRKKSRWI